MTPADYKLHELMLRHANGILAAHADMMRQATGLLAAYRTWLGKQVIEDPDPVEHFTEKAEALAKCDAELHRAE